MPFPSFLIGSRFSREAMYTTAINPQPNSPLLSLPAEVRQIIWGYVFEYDEKDTGRRSSEQLALLATCRLINFEAIYIALQHTNFHIRCQQSKSFSFRGIFHLGTMLVHLRYVTVTMPLDKVNCGSNNPFLLTQMPLNRLNINLTDDVPFTQRQGPDRESLNLRYKFVSALLYRTTPNWTRVGGGTSRILALDNHTKEVCDSLHRRLVRSLQVRTWNFEPTKTMLYDFMIHCRVRVVELRYMNSHGGPSAAQQHNWIWHALTHFQLVERRSTVFRVQGLRDVFGGIEAALAAFDESEVDEDEEQYIGWLFYNQGNVDVLRFSEATELGW